MKTILFDLDGTLLPMDQDAFVKYYMGLLAQKMAPHGYEPEKLVEAVWKEEDEERMLERKRLFAAGVKKYL
mgnify:CR=1 FL=1